MLDSSVLYCLNLDKCLCREWDTGVEKDVRHGLGHKRPETQVADFKLK